jgi:chorismate lyase/3-hydroxybenzoate synthase
MTNMKSVGIPRSLLADREISGAAAGLRIAYIDNRVLQPRLSASSAEPMAIVSFGQALPHNFSCPVIVPDLPQIASPHLAEVWTSGRPVHTATHAGVSMAMNGECLIGSISLDEKPDLFLDALTYKGYREILHHLQDSGYPYLWRVWNYFPHINDNQDGLERYRRFCVGRHQALADALAGFPFSLPAATAVGTRSGPLQIMFLAGTRPAQHIGNPRQLDAYEYPSEYGPRSPSFARATLFRSEQDSLLFIAGTASVVGHASRHIGQPDKQTHESIHNLLAVLEHAGSVAGIDFLDRPERAMYKVYVRDLDSLFEIRGALQRSPLPSRHLLFLQGDLCRKELLVEIEGLIISN